MVWLLLAAMFGLWWLCFNQIKRKYDKKEAWVFTLLMVIAAALIILKTQELYGLDMISHLIHLTKIS